ncbi:MAG: hypothetical protein KGS61_15115 [Verrucomicrobia bacterium]|nr:hypothetical protein [Verrucomicrobiota bacterium]
MTRRTDESRQPATLTKVFERKGHGALRGVTWRDKEPAMTARRASRVGDLSGPVRGCTGATGAVKAPRGQFVGFTAENAEDVEKAMKLEVGADEESLP